MNKKDLYYTVSVRLMTYMHALFIKEAMDGIMMQETDFKVEVVVGDDFSTDRTLDIIRSYSDTENIHIKILKREKGDEYWKKRLEIGRLHNFNNILENSSGKYVALLDGDDYWTDPLKLQKQVEFLEDNPKYEICFTNCSTVDEKSKIRNQSFLNYNKDESFTVEDLMFIAPTLTRVYRNRNYVLPDYTSITAIDAAYLIEQMKYGKAKYLNIVTANYRKHRKGIWSLKSELERKKSHLEIRIYGFLNTEGKVKLNFLKSTLRSLIKIRNLDKNSFLKIYDEFKLLYKDTDLSLKHRRFLSVFNFLNNFHNINKFLVTKLQLKIISML